MKTVSASCRALGPGRASPTNRGFASNGRRTALVVLGGSGTYTTASAHYLCPIAQQWTDCSHRHRRRQAPDATAVEDRAPVPDGAGRRTTNIRNVKSKHWTRWLGAENRCVVPFNSFSEFNKAKGGDIWFAVDASRLRLARFRQHARHPTAVTALITSKSRLPFRRREKRRPASVPGAIFGRKHLFHDCCFLSSRAAAFFMTAALVAFGTTITPSSSALTMSPGWTAT